MRGSPSTCIDKYLAECLGNSQKGHNKNEMSTFPFPLVFL